MARTLLYDQFTPAERVTLVIEALARGDEAEAQKLGTTCPRKSYTVTDAAYADRMDQLFDLLAVMCIDLRYAEGKLIALHGVIDAMGELDRWHHLNATLAFMDGVPYGKGEKSLEESDAVEEQDELQEDKAFDEDEGDETSNTEGDEDEEGDAKGGEEQIDDIECEDNGTPEAAIAAAVRVRSDPDYAQRLESMAAWSQRASARTLRELHLTATDIARGLIEGWKALGRFSQKHLGVEATTLLRAWWPQAVEGINEILTRYAELVPRDEEITEYAGQLEAAWVVRLGIAKA